MRTSLLSPEDKMHVRRVRREGGTKGEPVPLSGGGVISINCVFVIAVAVCTKRSLLLLFSL